MENNIKEIKPKKAFSLIISEAFLEGTLFLLFGPKKLQKEKRQIPPIYIVIAVIILFIFISVIKKATSRPKKFYPTEQYQPERPAPDRGIQKFREVPGGRPF